MYVISVQNTCNNSRVHRCETVIRLYALSFPLALHNCFSIIFEKQCYGGILKIREYRIMGEGEPRLQSGSNTRIPRSNGYSSSYIIRGTSVCTLKTRYFSFFPLRRFFPNGIDNLTCTYCVYNMAPHMHTAMSYGLTC